MEPRRKFIVIHCPTGKAGPPYEVLGLDGEPVGRYDTLADAEAAAAEAAMKAGATVILSPLARGSM